jgi:cytochrome c biogenesis protein CcdA
MGHESQTGSAPKIGGVAARLAVLAIFLLPVLVALGLLLVLIAVRNRTESAVADLAALAPLGWAFAAGMVASVNPCGFFMLPAYLSYQLATRVSDAHPGSQVGRTTRALLLGLVATSGFLLVLAAVGGMVAAGSQWLIRSFPYAGVTIGAALTLLGAWMLRTGRTVGLLTASRVHVVPQRSLRNIFFFGIAYATGSLSCTLPVFLLVIGTSLASRGLLASFGQFISFGLGMGSMLIAVTIGVAAFQDVAARALRAVLPFVHHISALFLIGAGLYLVYYWVWVSGAIL